MNILNTPKGERFLGDRVLEQNKTLVVFLFFVISISSFNGFFQTANAAPESNVLICHMDPGNSNDPYIIRIAQYVVDFHLAHGDSLGSCDPTDRIDEINSSGNAGATGRANEPSAN